MNLDKIKFTLKPEFKKKDRIKIKTYKSITKNYFVSLFGQEEGLLVYNLRKILNNPISQAKIILENELYENENQKSKVLKIEENYRNKLSKGSKKRWETDYEKYKKINQNSTSKLDRNLKVRKGLQEYWESDRSKEHRNKLNKNQYSLIERKKVINKCRENKNLIIEYEDKKMNDIEFMVFSCLKHLNIEFEFEKKFFINEHNYFADFYLSKYNLVVEIYGDYWHRNPKYFESSDEEVIKIKERDQLRQVNFIKNNIRYTYFWEDLIRNNLDKVYKFFLNLKNKII